MPARPLQERFEGIIRGLADTPDDLSSFRGHRGETLTVEPWMAESLRDAEARVRRLRLRVEQRLADTMPRTCLRCRKPVVGRADRKYCSDTCRQAAHRSRHSRKITDPAGMAPSARRRLVLMS